MAAGSPIPCPRCGAPVSGKFCSGCGAPVGEHSCASCGASLAPGAKFCHKCGTPADGLARLAGVGVPGATPRAVDPGPGYRAPMPLVPLPRSGSQQVPWIVAGVLLIITIAAVMFAGSRRNDAAAPAMANAGNAFAGGVPAPDISKMTPKEQFDRLMQRTTAAAESGDTATVERFWPMTIGAYQNLPTADRGVDAEFDIGWLHLFAAQYPEAKALADTILAAAPNHLLGYFLRAKAASAQGDSAGAREARQAFAAHYKTELAKKDRPEYARHQAMLAQFRDAIKAP